MPFNPFANPASGSCLWQVYDLLLTGVDRQATVETFAAGLHWFGVKSGVSLGMAMAPSEGRAAPTGAGAISGTSLREAAARAKSWNFADAALGMAAINAHYNAPERIRGIETDDSFVTHTGTNAFEYMLPRLVGKRVAVVGHFRGLELLAEHCELTILERKPQSGDLPDPACEDVLPRSDYVFMTATTLINKTMPRLLELSRNAFVSVVGPTTPLTPLWFDLGVDLIAGLVVEDVPAVWPVIQEGGQHSFFDRGTRMIQIERRSEKVRT